MSERAANSRLLRSAAPAAQRPVNWRSDQGRPFVSGGMGNHRSPNDRRFEPQLDAAPAGRGAAQHPRGAGHAEPRTGSARWYATLKLVIAISGLLVILGAYLWR